MQESARLNLFICSMVLIVFQGTVQGEESRATRLLQKATDCPLDGNTDPFFSRIAFLYACQEDWIAAQNAIKKIQTNHWKDQTQLTVVKTTILFANEEWENKFTVNLDRTADDLLITHSLHAAAQGNFEKTIQFAIRVKDEHKSNQLYCELVKDFGNRGEFKHANELFLRALAQEESGTSRLLFEAAFATRYRPLIQEMYSRNYVEAEQLLENGNYVDYFLSDATPLYARNGFVDEALESLGKIDSMSERLSTQNELFDIFIEDGNEEGIQQLIEYRLKHDQSFSLPDDMRSRIIDLKLRQKEWKAAEREIWRLKDNFFKANSFANLSIQLFAAGDSKSAKHMCSVAGQVIALAYSEKIKNNYEAGFELWGKYVEALSRQAVALYVTGEIEKSEVVIQKALKIGNDRSGEFGSPFDFAAAEILAAFQVMGKATDAHEFVMQILNTPAYRTGTRFARSDPLVQWLKSMLNEYGLDSTKEYIHITKNKELKFRLFVIVGQLQLQTEGPDADLEWIDKLQRANARGTIYLRAAEKELAPQVKKLETQIERVRPFPPAPGCIFFGGL